MLHIGGGTLALFSAPFAIYLRKQTPKHRIAGRIYFWIYLCVWERVFNCIYSDEYKESFYSFSVCWSVCPLKLYLVFVFKIRP